MRRQSFFLTQIGLDDVVHNSEFLKFCSCLILPNYIQNKNKMKVSAIFILLLVGVAFTVGMQERGEYENNLQEGNHPHRPGLLFNPLSVTARV